MTTSTLITRLAGAALAAILATGGAQAADPVKVGLILPMTGPFSSTGRQIEAAAKLYVQQHGDVAGRHIELLVRDDAGVPDTTKRLAQEMVVNDHVSVLAGFGLTPLALAAAPIATRGKVPEIVMAAATSTITQASPFIVRTSQTVPQIASVMGEWAAANGLHKVVSIVSDYGPGIDCETWFRKAFEAKGGQVPEALRVPLANPDFAPFLQRAADAKPDAVFIFVPSGAGSTFIRQFVERGLDKSGIKLIGSGDVTDDDLLNGMGNAAVGTVTAQHYSALHDSAANKEFTQAFRQANNNMRPNFMAVGGYDGMALVYKALEKTGGNTDGAALVDAMKGLSWESPRGPITIDPATRDIVQNVYVRKVEQVNGELYNVEFATFPAVKDPAKADAK